jgi:hypothetical protein
MKTNDTETPGYLFFERLDESPPWWPEDIQILVIQGGKLQEMAPLPRGLRELHVTGTKLSVAPDLSRCPQLELADLHNNYLTSWDYPLPASLMTLDLSFNKLRSFEADLVLMGRGPLASLDLSYNFLTEDPPDGIATNLAYDHNSIPWQEYSNMSHLKPAHAGGHCTIPRHIRMRCGLNGGNQVASAQLYSNQSQNVHLTSIQKSVQESLNILKKKYEGPPSGNQWLDTMLNLVFPESSSAFKRILWWKEGIKLRKLVEEWTSSNEIHSCHGISFRHLLGYVWLAANDHTSSTMDIISVLRQELKASCGVCATGRFTRVLNTLCGFVDGIQLAVSLQEQLQARSVTIVDRASRKEITLSQALDEMRAALNDAKVSPMDHDSWLQAVRDLFDGMSDDEEETGSSAS